MSKRMGFQFRQPRSKMPKLDITIQSSQRITAGPSNMNPQRDIVAETPTQPDGNWSDEEEFFVLSSQAADMVHTSASVVISQSMNSLANHDMSYTRFRQEVRTVHSTQINPIKEVLNDDDDDLFSNIDEPIPNAIQAAPNAETPKTNGQNVQNQQFSQNFNRPSTSTSTVNNKLKEQSEKIQCQYYAEKIKAQKKQIETLRETLNKVNQKCTTKEGESSTLRYEVDSKSRDIERLRKEKMDEAVQMEKKYSEKITALEKKIEEQRSELEFKNIEILNKKSRRSLNDSVMTTEPETSWSIVELHHLFKLHTNHIEPAAPENIPAADFIAAKGVEKYCGLTERDFDTLKCLNALQSIYNGAKRRRMRVLDTDSVKEIISITNAFIYAMKSYANRLCLRVPTKYDAGLEAKLISDEMAKPTANLIDDKLIYERQILAVISLLCTDFSNVTEIILFEKCEDQETNTDDDDEMDVENRAGSFVDILTDVLFKIGLSKTLSLHKTLIESTSLLLLALAKTYSPSKSGDLLLLNLFRLIVFCEPDLQSLNHLSEFLELISDYELCNICSRFCNDTSTNVMSMQRYCINRFDIETCPLQVFSCILQISFQPYSNNRSTLDHTNKVHTVAKITIHMIKFLRNCFNRRVDWLFPKNRSQNDSSTLTQGSHCYSYVVSCIIVLLHFCINSWWENYKIIDYKLIQTIYSMGSLFIHDIIKKHYDPKVLSLGGFPVKNRLQVIYDWIVYSNAFDLTSISENAIKSVNLRQIQQMNEPQMPEKSYTHDQMDSILVESFDNFLI
ncbi:uncharacterized protein LOC116347582 [Contarinia nasturtii]|uniref:uncharacterized protein LOC116347582 n=1 Tax=Contarinia nasturtii TaxID=265458 RepID=UPI0012D39005|nr:uncharacterized protein LOC116347582 [Contarinia nasturtii]